MAKGPSPVSSTRDGILRRIRKFRRDNQGVAAIEFALIAPIMIGLYVMLNETASGLRAARKVTMAARITSDLATQLVNVSDADRNDIFASLAPILSPFNASLASIRITSIRFDANGKGYVDWSEAQGTALPARNRCMPTQVSTPPSPFGVLDVPAGLRVADTSVVLAEVSFAYTPVLGYNITGTINLSDQLYTRPRTSSHVTRTGSPTTACPV